MIDSTLIQTVQYTTKKAIREELCTEIYYEILHVSNRNITFEYDFSSLFKRVLGRYGAHFSVKNRNLYDYIFYSPHENDENVLLTYCIENVWWAPQGGPLWAKDIQIANNRCDEEYRDDLLVQFIEFISSFNLRLALQIVTNYSESIQYRIVYDCFNIKHLDKILMWDKRLQNAIFFNDNNSFFHYHLSEDRSRGRYDLEKLKMIVSALGHEYLKWIPCSDQYVCYNLVNHLFSRCEWAFDNYDDDYMPKENMMLWLIDECPQALRMSSNGKGRKHNVFAMVVELYNRPDNKKHKEIVGRVMKYADVDEDIYGVVPETGGETLLAYARSHGNNLVLEFFRTHFGIE